MQEVRYQTQTISLLYTPGYPIEVVSNGWIPCQKVGLGEIPHFIEELSDAGWRLISSIKRKHTSDAIQVVDLYFRKALETLPNM